ISKGVSDSQTLKQMIGLLKEGKKLILFPEGKRSENGEILPLQKGLSFLVYKANCKVIPAYIEGAFHAWPYHRKWPKLFGKMKVVFGSPIEWDPNLEKTCAQKKITKETEAAIKEL